MDRAAAGGQAVPDRPRSAPQRARPGPAVVLTAVLLAVQNPWLLLLPVAAVPPLLAGRVAERVLDRARTATAEPTRTALNLFHLATSARLAGELRVSGVQDELRARHDRLWAAATRGLWRAHLTATWVRAAGQVVFALAYIAGVLLVVRDAIAGRRGVGDVVLVIVLAAQVNQQVATAVALLQDLQRMAGAYRRLTEVTATVTGVDQAPPGHSPPTGCTRGSTSPGWRSPTREPTSRCCARSTSTSRPAPPSRSSARTARARRPWSSCCAASTGRPRAGSWSTGRTCGTCRSTVADADRGRVPGLRPVRVRGAAEWSASATCPVRRSEPRRVRAALDRADAAGVVDDLPDGLRTQLGKSYADGAELSGGQWQKLALGRAMMRENRCCSSWTSRLGARRAKPSTSCSSVRRPRETGRRPDRGDHRLRVPPVLHGAHGRPDHRGRDGRVVETGDHATLIAGAGLYAELFALQAKAYG